MSYCFSCGSPLNENAKFCSSCGAPVPKATEEKENKEQEKSSAIAENAAEATNDTESKCVNEPEITPETENTPDKPSTIEVPPETAPCETNVPNMQTNSYGRTQNVHVPQTPKGSSVGVKILSVFLCIILGAVLFTASLIGIARGIMSSSGVEDIVGEMGLTIVDDIVSVSIDGEEIRFSEQILDAVDEDIKKKYNLNEDTIADVLRATKADEFVSEVISDYTGYIIDGDELNALDGKRVVGWIRENESEIEDVISYEFTEADYKKLESDIDKSDLVRSLSEDEIKDEAGDVIAAIRAGLSVWIFGAAVGVSILLGLLIVSINRRKIRAIFTYISVTLAVVGGLQLLIFTLAYIPTVFFLPMYVVNIIGGVVYDIAMCSLAALIFGIGSAIACKLICDRKKYHA